MTLKTAIAEAAKEVRGLKVRMGVVKSGKRYFPVRMDWFESLPNESPFWRRIEFLEGTVCADGTLQTEW